jgi:hypothetical protein
VDFDAGRSFGIDRRPIDGNSPQADRVGDASGRAARVDDMIEPGEAASERDVANGLLHGLAAGGDRRARTRSSRTWRDTHAPGRSHVRVLALPSGETSRVTVTVAWPGASWASAAASSPSTASSVSAAGVSQSPHVLSRGKRARSISVTACPRLARCQPAAAPAGPAPTIATRALRPGVTEACEKDEDCALKRRMLHNRSSTSVDGSQDAV